jgi:O-antigen ligase
MEGTLTSRWVSQPRGQSRYWFQAVVPALTALLLGSAAFWNTIDIHFGPEGDEGAVTNQLNWMNLVKLSIAGGCGVLGLLGVALDRRVRQCLCSGPGLLLVLLSVLFLVTSLWAYPEVARVSQAAALIFLAYLLFVPTALAVLGLRRIAVVSLVGLSLNLILNWAVYLLLPEIGVFEESLAAGDFISRMGGLGHPNAIARTGAISAVLSLALLKNPQQGPVTAGGRLLLRAVLVLGALTIVAALSRTAMVAMIAACSAVLIDRLLTRAGVAWMMLAASAVLCGVLLFELAGGRITDLLLATTKTGEVTELTSATGRTEIWAEAVRLILQRPITGWGLNSTPTLMEDYSRHTHNLLLHVAFSGGLLAAATTTLLLLWNLTYGLTSNEPVVRAVSMYVLVSGLFEDTVMDTFCSPLTLLWIAVIVYPAMLARGRRFNP